jgi:hypothetical protein
MGFSQVVYPAHVILRAVLALDEALAGLRRFAAGGADLTLLADPAAARGVFREAVREREWAAAEQLGKPA